MVRRSFEVLYIPLVFIAGNPLQRGYLLYSILRWCSIHNSFDRLGTKKKTDTLYGGGTTAPK